MKKGEIDLRGSFAPNIILKIWIFFLKEPFFANKKSSKIAITT